MNEAPSVFLNVLAKITQYKVLDLNTLNFNDYDNESKNSGDDFLPTIRQVVADYNHIVWATPVYWYSISALMKRFIDRISDCLRIEKNTGRQFRGMSMSLLSVSNDVCNRHFTTAFELTAEYLGMAYLGHQHVVVNQDDLASIAKQLQNWPPLAPS